MRGQSARDKVGTEQKQVVAAKCPFCALFGGRRVGKALVGGRLWVFEVWGYGLRGARAIGEIARKTTEKDRILGSNDGKRQKKRVKSRENRGVLC